MAKDKKRYLGIFGYCICILLSIGWLGKPGNLAGSQMDGVRMSSTATVVPGLNLKPDELKDTRVRFWHPWSGERAQQVEMLVDEFNRKNEWGITAQIFSTGGSGTLYEQVKSNLKGGQLPHLTVAPIDHLAGWNQIYADSVIDLEPYVTDPEWGLSEKEITDFPELFWKYGAMNGIRHGIPAQWTVQVMFYNQTWARELGFNAAPVTPEEFEKQACAAAKANLADSKRENDGTGGWIVDMDANTLASWWFAFGGRNLPDLEAQGYQFNTVQLRDAFVFLRKMFDQNCAWVPRESLPYSYFANRNALFYSGTLEETSLQMNINQRAGSKDEWTIISFPAKDKKPVVFANGLSYAILRSEKKEQLASWLLIRWLSLARNQAKIIEAGATLPIGSPVIDMLEDFGKKSPQWKQAVSWQPYLKMAPRIASWRNVRIVLVDSYWQVFQNQMTVDKIPEILKQLDDTVAEVVRRMP